MSVTKLKTVGSWYAAYSQDITASERTMRGRVITGMLTGGEGPPSVYDTGPPVGADRPRGHGR